MNCEDCGTKLIIITTSYGQLIYCPKCCTLDVEKTFMNRGKGEDKMKLTKQQVEEEVNLALNGLNIWELPFPKNDLVLVFAKVLRKLDVEVE